MTSYDQFYLQLQFQEAVTGKLPDYLLRNYHQIIKLILFQTVKTESKRKKHIKQILCTIFPRRFSFTIKTNSLW